MTSSRTLNFAAIGFLFAVIVIVFWQIQTDFNQQGIASGGPYDNAASYPRTIAVSIGILLALQLAVTWFSGRSVAQPDEPGRPDLARAGMMLVVFAIYLATLTTAGYHLATAPMIAAIMWLCGMRNILKLAVTAIAIATGFAFVFEVFLNVVLPLGIWDIFIPW